jgi:CheY-like chemotaxis protein
MPEVAAAGAEHRQAGQRPTSDAGRWRILIVDDDADFADMLAISMERLGHDVVVATDPHDAVALVEEDATACDLVITDQTMPRLSGLECVALVKQKRADLPCILCTAYGQNVTPEIARRSGASAYVPKPIDPVALGETVKKLLDGRSA